MIEFIIGIVIGWIAAEIFRQINKNPKDMSNKQYAQFLDQKVEQARNWENNKKVLKQKQEEEIEVFKNRIEKMIAIYKNNEKRAKVYDGIIYEYQLKYMEEDWYTHAFVDKMFKCSYDSLTYEDEFRKEWEEKERNERV